MTLIIAHPLAVIPGRAREPVVRSRRQARWWVAIALAAAMVAALSTTVDRIRRDNSPWTAAGDAQQLALGAGFAGITVTGEVGGAGPVSIVRHGGTVTATASSPHRFVGEYAALFGLAPSAVGDLEILSDSRSSRTGARFVELGRRDSGREVVDSSIKVVLDRSGRVAAAGGTALPGVTADHPISLSAVEAYGVLARQIGIDPATTVIDAQRDGPSQTTELHNRHASRAPINAELVTVGTDTGGRIAWRLYADTPDGWRMAMVDAETGALLRLDDRTAHAPAGEVFVGENPNESTRSVVPLIGEPFNAAGWVADRTTTGNNADAYQDLNNDDIPDYRPQTPPSGDPDYQQFVYPFTNAFVTSGGSDVMTDRDAALTQAFYRVNQLHDYFYDLGFDEAARNFQTDNFGRGGLGGDPMLVEVHNDFNDPPANREGSNTQVGPDGMTARMELSIVGVDAALDADLVTHEYTHGVTNRLLNNGGLPQDEQTWALGEAWSDFYGTSVWDDPIAGEYVCGNSNGCPLYHYDASPLVYSDLCTLHPSGCEPHRDGEIFTAALWDIRGLMIARYGHTAGKHRTEQLVLDGVRATVPPQATFLDARNGLLTADQLSSGGADQCLLWAAFARREMGVSAATSPDQMTVTPATDVPSGCEPTAEAGGPYTTTEGTTVTLSASVSSAGSDPSTGSLTYAWDLDDDGDYDDATGVAADFAAVGQDGTFTVGVEVTNGAGLSDIDSATVIVTNVAPSVALDPIATTTEGSSFVLTGLASDSGWLDALTATVDWGDGTGLHPVGGILENDRPNATLTWDASHTYGDDGQFTVEVCVADDDAQTCAATGATVTNVDPTVAIQPDGQVVYGGTPVYIQPIASPIEVTARVTDPGSDDLAVRWDWADGATTTTVSLIHPPNPDPDPSPTVEPRDVTLAASHSYADACLYEIIVGADDDDGGSGDDSASAVVVGDATKARPAGWWMNQFRPQPKAFSEVTLDCYLAIATQLSTAFTTPMTRADAFAALFPGDDHGSSAARLDRQILTTWMNIANGAISLGHTAGDAATVADVLLAAETARLDPGSTSGELNQHRIALVHVNSS